MARIIHISDDARRSIAEKIVKERASPNLDGKHFTDGERIWFYGNTALWEPWSDDCNVVAIEDLITDYDPDPTPGWEDCPQYPEWVAAYLEDMEDDGALEGGWTPEICEVIAWARENCEDEVEAIEQFMWELTVDDVEGIIPMTVDLDELYPQTEGVIVRFVI